MRIFYLKGQKVGLAEFLEDDYRLMYDIQKDPVTQRNFNVKFRWERYEDYVRFFTDPERPPYRFVTTIVRLEDGMPVGRISVSPSSMDPDLGIWVFKRFQNMGYGSEAVVLAVKYLFENVGLDYVVVGIYEHNAASWRLFENVGFQRAPEYDEVEKNVFGQGEIVQVGFVLEKEKWVALQS